MKILGINGSHRAHKGTAALLEAALAAARDAGAETELVELSELSIAYCIGCNACMRKPQCALKDDDMPALVEKMLNADGIILASPDYFSHVSSRMKTFMERTRPQHMVANAFKGKVGGALVTAGLPDCGGEQALADIDHFFAIHEMLVVHARPEGPVLSNGPVATQFDGVDEEERPMWRRVQDDRIAFAAARQLGTDMVELISCLMS